MIFVNFKTYEQGTGEATLSLAEICRETEEQTSVKIIPVVQAVDIFRLTNRGFEVWAQHIDNIEYGQNTGQILPQAVIEAGAKGAILNHSENKLPVEVIGETIEKIRMFKNSRLRRGFGGQANVQNFRILVCAESIEEGKQIASLKPDLIAYEPPELIGRDTSVSVAKPEVISEFVREIKEIPVLIGAGIHSQADIKKGLELGAKGFLVASDVVLAQNPKQELLDLAKGFL